VSDHAGLAKALGLPRPAAPDAPLRLQPGDILVTAGSTATGLIRSA
jgi:hypothetical protein